MIISKKRRFDRISKRIQEIKIQGARNIAKVALKAYSLVPTKQSKKKLLSLRPTEPMMENLILGNLILPIDEKTKVKKNRITQKVDNYIVISEYDTKTKKIISVNITEPNTVNSVEIFYEKYEQVDSILYPKKITINY